MGAPTPLRPLCRHALVALRSQDFDKRIKADKPVPATKLRKDGTPRKNAAKVKLPKEPRLIRPATVNRSVVELLQTVLLFGIEKRKYIFPDKPDFAAAKLAEVVKPDRQITHDQQIALEEAMEDREDYAVAYDFASLTGLRRKVVAHLEWSQVEWGQTVIRTVGKGGKQHITPIVGHI